MTSAVPALRILVVDDEPAIRRTLAMCLEADGHRVSGVGNPADARDAARRLACDLAFVDLRLGTTNGMDLIPALLADSPWLKVVVITAYATIDSAVEAMRRGAYDYLPKPFTPAQVTAVARQVAHLRALELRIETLQGDGGRGDADLASASPPMQRAVDLARQVAPSAASVLLRGESGTGKGVIARAIHGWSPRAARAFAVVSCPSLSAELLESELFGHVKGAFTGAQRDHPGRVALAEGGTLFLDEVGDLPGALQAKLLRFLQDRAYERVGDTVTREADVRVVAATNVDLEAAVRAGRFREDLLYRLNVITIDLPPLRQRTEDIVALALRLLATLKGGKPVVAFTPAAETALRAYPWPGNVRELRNVVERATILCNGTMIGVEHLPTGFAPAEARPEAGDLVTLDAVEEQHIRRVLARTTSIDEATRVLGIDAATLWRRRRKYGL